MDGDGVMDRDTHMDCQWVCGVYSQLEWFSNAQNALLLRCVTEPVPPDLSLGSTIY
jgi:hypothetical protein